jgi:UDP-N-acetylmuramoyl-L-alanyl-D-glutamate--2,6-diaminopimelate ligase
VKLSQLYALLPGNQIQGSGDPEINQVVYDSRKASSGCLFVAIEGEKSDGHQFIQQAISKGAVAVIVERRSDQTPSTPIIIVPNSRRALAIIAGALAGRPDRKMDLTAITGTNGKTTTAFLLAEIFTEHYGKSGLIGTVGNRIGNELEAQDRTTPEAPDLWDLLSRMLAAGCGGAAMEVSSHALVLDRVYGVSFNTAAFTNLSQDHLDFHGDFESYFAAKAKLFQDYQIGSAVINMDDPYGQRLLKLSNAPIITYSLLADADVQADDLKLSVDSILIRATTPRGKIEFQSPLVGRFNAYNLLCGLAVCEAMSIPHDKFCSAASIFHGAPGRLERFNLKGRWVYVDYAHSPEAIEQVARELKKLIPGELHILLGCGGNRDRSKRPLMGKSAERYADKLIITTDNPRDEDPKTIIAEIIAGLEKPDLARIIVDRAEAIAVALAGLPPYAALLIAGKGHENYQEIRGVKHHFDDREQVRNYLNRLKP